MKEKLAILLLVIYLFGSTDAYQLLKLPLLAGHYVKHKSESPYMTLGSFFKMHYIDPQPFDNDYKQDMRLPFKTVLNVYGRNLPTDLTIIPHINFRAPVKNTGLPVALNDNISPLLLTYTIFQPPRA
ncbi:hypothetical protein [Niastella yeongjuensis]|uniref:hypothetical protein n=1 Tax=Niastella yeongjuensis TaxID=354355 RepID=UPI001054BB38|nr:hypothetical protein [Niastella yeongjuensis]